MQDHAEQMPQGEQAPYLPFPMSQGEQEPHLPPPGLQDEQQAPRTFRDTLDDTEQMAFDRLPPAMRSLELFNAAPQNEADRRMLHSVLMATALASNPIVPPRAEPASQGIGNKLKALPEPEKYQGNQQGNAARHWLRDCERYFETRRDISGLEEPETYKVIVGRTHLTGAAQVAWRGQEAAVESGHAQRITTWAAFRAWILDNFEAKTAEADRYRAYIGRLQKSDSFTEYFRKLQEASLNLARPADEYNFILQLVSGLNHELRAEWYKQHDPPSKIAEVYNRLIELERSIKEAAYTKPNRFQTGGRALANRAAQDVDAMDLSLMNDRKPLVCYHCNRVGHMKRDCRSLKKGEEKVTGQ
jgi:hypothetical protein